MCWHKKVARSCWAVIITLLGMVVKRAMWLQAPEFLHRYDLLGPVHGTQCRPFICFIQRWK